METTVLPNFLICSDIRRSLSIFYWRAENPIKLEPKGASFKTHTLYASEFFDSLSDNLRVMIADDQKNINLISFSVTSIGLSDYLLILSSSKNGEGRRFLCRSFGDKLQET